MSTLKLFQEKIQENRKKTPWREFVKQIASWQPNVFYKYDNIVSRYPKTDRIGWVIKYDEFYENNTPEYYEWISYNHEKGFFENVASLREKMLFPNMINFFMSENCDYGDVVSKGKNIYLSTFVVNGDENVFYSFGVKDECVNVMSSGIVWDHSENVYQSLGITNSFAVFYSKYIVNCSNIWFSSNLLGCHDCVMCDGLENMSYCILNKQYTKESYEKTKDKILKQKQWYWGSYMKVNGHSNNFASNNVSGTYLVESDDIQQGHYTYRIKGGRNIINVWWFEGNSNIYDVVDGWWPSLHDIYGVNGIAINSEHCYVSCHVPNCQNVYYSYYLESCSNCLGCFGLKNKEYCILNKQYTKEQYEEKAVIIFKQMEQNDHLWEFFPAEMNPFYFNDTVASLVVDFEKDEVTSAWFLRRDEEIKVDIPSWVETITVDQLDEYEWRSEDWSERKLSPEILKKVIVDKEGNYYRIIPLEFKFLKRYWLPLPRMHWLTRLRSNFR